MLDLVYRLPRIPLLETVWKIRISSILDSHECSKWGPRDANSPPWVSQIHTLQSLLAIFQTVSRRGILRTSPVFGSAKFGSCSGLCSTAELKSARPQERLGQFVALRP